MLWQFKHNFTKGDYVRVATTLWFLLRIVSSSGAHKSRGGNLFLLEQICDKRVNKVLPPNGQWSTSSCNEKNIYHSWCQRFSSSMDLPKWNLNNLSETAKSFHQFLMQQWMLTAMASIPAWWCETNSRDNPSNERAEQVK